MPVRRFVAGKLAEKLRGTHIFTRGVSDTITRERLQDAYDTADAIYCHVVDLIDFERIAIEAHLRCMTLDHPGKYGGACGKCLRDACLAVDRFYGDGDPDELPSAVCPPRSDWGRAVARVIRYRRPK